MFVIETEVVSYCSLYVNTVCFENVFVVYSCGCTHEHTNTWLW